VRGMPAQTLEGCMSLLRESLLVKYPALRSAEFRRYTAAQLLSLTGTWMQTISLPWVAYRLTGSIEATALVGAAQALPITMFAVFAGAVLDQRPRRPVVLATQSGLALLAVLVALLLLSGWLNFGLLLACAFAIGVCTAVDQTARAALVAELVDKEALANGAAVGFVVFNFSRLLGPAIAGLVIAAIGPGWSLLLNAVTSLPLLALLCAKLGPRPVSGKLRAGILRELAEGFLYVRSQPVLWTTIATVAAMGVCGFNFSVLLPPLLSRSLGLQEATYGVMLTALGLGGFVGALAAASEWGTVNGGKLVALMPWLTALLLGALSLIQGVGGMLAIMALLGFANITFFSAANSLLQVHADPRFRARVSGMYVLCFGGMTPVGNTLSGFFGERAGPQVAFAVMAATLVAGVALIRLASVRRQRGAP
jgi:MFS family permease